MKKYLTFTEFLADVHAKQYHGLDNEMPEDFEEWLADLGVDEIIDFADKHAQETSKTAMENAFKRFQQLQSADRSI